jgi:DNA-binding NtrC family response regulator
MEDVSYFVLAVDDDFTQIELLKDFIKVIEYPSVRLFTAATVAEALRLIDVQAFDLVLTDYRLPDGSGLDILKHIKARNPTVKVVVMTAFEDARQVIDIFKNGGDDYLIKPTSKTEIEHLLVRSFDQSSVEHENESVDSTILDSFLDLPIICNSDGMRTVINIVSRASNSDATVLLTGESGTGKELIARLIHQSSQRKSRPFVTINIAALPESLMESELFGHVKGSFTGASQDREGRFGEADGGTLFIDEIGDIPPAIQVKLLRAIQFGQIQRVGENHTRVLDVRIIAATNKDLKSMMDKGAFRSDLYWRLHVVPIHLPALRERKEDIPVLVQHFIEKFSTKNKRDVKTISREALDLLMRHPFPGNVRELENILERALLMTRGPTIFRKDILLNDSCMSPSSDESADETATGYEARIQLFERTLLMEALGSAGWNQSQAARILGIGERRLRSRMEILGILKPGSSPEEPCGSTDGSSQATGQSKS